MREGGDRRYFFVHVMKTGGTTFRQHINANFSSAERYPETGRDGDMVMAKLSVPHLLELPPERHAQVRIYTGHFPLAAARALDQDLTVLTILRDPVARVISHLKQEQRHDPARSLEELYDDPRINPRMICNLQARMFAFRPEDNIENFADVIEIDDERFKTACAGLASVDLFGLQDRFDEFLRAVEHRYGWTRVNPINMRVSSPVQVSQALMTRIIRDNSADVAFYEHALTLYKERREATRSG